MKIAIALCTGAISVIGRLRISPPRNKLEELPPSRLSASTAPIFLRTSAVCKRLGANPSGAAWTVARISLPFSLVVAIALRFAD